MYLLKPDKASPITRFSYMGLLGDMANRFNT